MPKSAKSKEFTAHINHGQGVPRAGARPSTATIYNANVRIRDLPRDVDIALGDIAALNGQCKWEVIRDALISFVHNDRYLRYKFYKSDDTNPCTCSSCQPKQLGEQITFNDPFKQKQENHLCEHVCSVHARILE